MKEERMKSTKILSIVLLAAGAVLLILGIYQFVEFRQSAGGKIASGLNQISNAFGGSTQVAKGYVQPIILIAGGVVAGAAGFFLNKKR